MLKILFFGDVMGSIGRKAITKILPVLKKEYKPNLIAINAENLAHGKGITEKTLEQMKKAGVDFLVLEIMFTLKIMPTKYLFLKNLILLLQPMTPGL